MTLTVRLDATLEGALDRYCADRGVTKSLVVQESLAAYLLAGRQAASGADSPPPGGPGEPSALFKAFQQAGLVGTGALGGGTADKAAVRARAMQRIRRSAAT